MSARLHAIREACNLEPDMRTEENVNDVLDFVKDVKFFARLSVLQQRSLCRTMSLEEFGPREFVFQMGESGDKFYIILSGSVGVQVPSQTAACPNDVHADKCDCPNRPLETVVFLEKGMGFGELALQSDQPRSATIQTSEKTELLVMKRTNYEMYAGQHHRQFIEQRVKFLRHCPRIEDVLQMGAVSMQDIAAMANCLNEVQLPASGSAVACRQGDVVEHMIFVRSGQLAILRCVDVEQNEPSPRKPVNTRSPRNRATAGNVSSPGQLQNAAKEIQQKHRDTGASDADQPQWQLTQNLAKAIMEMKKKDRKQRMDAMDEEEGENSGDVKEGSAASKGGGSESRGAKLLWTRLQTSVKAARHVQHFAGKDSDDGPKGWQKGVEEAEKSVEHFAAVQAARRRYTRYTFKKLSEEDKKAKSEGRTNTDPLRGRRASRFHMAHQATNQQLGLMLAPKVPEPMMSGKKQRSVRILRIGTIGPYEYFGDQQVCGSEKYPVSLVSDPVAEIYIMSKHDILRRVPKKLFSALFNTEKEEVPSDAQLLEMHRQTERWNAFRRSMHGEALGNLSARNQIFGGGRGMRDPSSGSRIDAVANLEFLGVNPHTNLGQSLLSLPDNKGVALTPKDEELFSQASAWFLRRFDIMKRDHGLRDALLKAGLMRNSRLHDGLPGSALDDDDRDPMAFRFDQHWQKLQKDPVGLDLDDVLSEDKTGGQQLPAAPAAPPTTGRDAALSTSTASASQSRTSVKVTGRRASTVVEQHIKRQSAVGSPANSIGSFGGGDDVAPRSTASGAAASRSSYSVGAHATAGLGSSAKPRQSMKQQDLPVGVELPSIDSARDGKTSSRPPSTANSGARRVVGFTES